jgi:hypothetical protein
MSDVEVLAPFGNSAGIESEEEPGEGSVGFGLQGNSPLFGSAIVFGVVTRVAGCHHILPGVFAATRLWENVVNGKVAIGSAVLTLEVISL